MSEPEHGMIELSVIAPMYNEEGVVEAAVGKLAGAVAALGVSWELILVNDGSTDGTEGILRRCTAGLEGVRVVSYRENRGRGYALREGFSRSRGRYVVTTESDLTWGEGIIGALYEELKASGAEVVVASPYARGGGGWRTCRFGGRF